MSKISEDIISAFQEMAEYAQWVAWKKGPVKDNGKFPKVPYSPKTECKMDGTHESGEYLKNAGTFEEALAAQEKLKADGIGFVLSRDDPFSAVDIDGCLGNGGDPGPLIEILERFDSYAEISPSGKGIRIFCKGQLPEGAVCNPPGTPYEIYDCKKFLTLTGNPYGKLRPLREAQDAVQWFCQTKTGIREGRVEQPQEKPDKTLAEIAKDLELAKQALQSVPADEYETWLHMGFALHSTGAGEYAYQVWDQWSRTSEKYDERDQAATWQSIRGNERQVTLGSLFEIAKQHGWQYEKVPEPVQEAKGQEQKEESRQPSISEKKPGFNLVQAGQLEIKAPKWLARDYLEADSLAVVFGDPSTGNSFLGLDIACSISSGKDFHGQDVDPGTVVYIAGEGHNGLVRRRRAWEIRHGIDLSTAPLFMSTGPAAMCDPGSLSEVLQAIDQTAQAGAPKLVILDTLARNFGPGDESSTKDMTSFVQAADTLRTRYGCTVLVIHHTGHLNKDRARGAMALKGAADAEFRVEKDESGTVRFCPVKMKDAAIPDPLAFNLRTVELGIQDEDGREVTSAVLDRTEYEPPVKQTSAGRGRWQTVATEQLERLYAEHRARLERGGYDPESARVTVDDWKEACFKAGIKKTTFHEAKKSLQEHGKITFNHGYVELG